MPSKSKNEVKVGQRIEALVKHVTSDAAAKRFYGAEWDKQRCPGIVTRVEKVLTNPSGKVKQTRVTATYSLPDGRQKSVNLNKRSVYIVTDESPPANPPNTTTATTTNALLPPPNMATTTTTTAAAAALPPPPENASTTTAATAALPPPPANASTTTTAAAALPPPPENASTTTAATAALPPPPANASTTTTAAAALPPPPENASTTTAATAALPPPPANASTTTAATDALPPPPANASTTTTAAAALPPVSNILRRSPVIDIFYDVADNFDDLLDSEVDPIDIAQVAHDMTWEKPAEQTVSVTDEMPAIQWCWIDAFGDRLYPGSRNITLITRLEIFYQVFPREAIDTILTLTNEKLARGRSKKLTEGELIRFIGLIILATRFEFGS
jgi:hypothetical protein